MSSTDKIDWELFSAANSSMEMIFRDKCWQLNVPDPQSHHWLKHDLKIAARPLRGRSIWKIDQMNFTFLLFCSSLPRCNKNAVSLLNRCVLRPSWILNFSGSHFCSNSCLHVSRLRSSSGCLSEATWNLCNNQCCVERQDKASANPPARHFTAIYSLSGCNLRKAKLLLLIDTDQVSARVRALRFKWMTSTVVKLRSEICFW